MVYRMVTRGIKAGCTGLITTLGVWCFVLSVGFVLDLDHLLVLAWKGLPITWENLATQAGRPLHIPAMVFIVGITCVYLARIDRFWKLS